MTDPHRDPDELLRAANPIDEKRLPHPAESTDAQLLYEKITGTPYTRDRQPTKARRWRWTHLRISIAAMIGLGGIGGGIAYAVVSQQPTKHLEVACYANASLNASLTQVSATSAGPLNDCARAWSSGNVPGHLAGAPPPLDACVLRSGIAGVFPDRTGTHTICRQLGLQPISPTPPAPLTTSRAPGSSISAVPTTTVPPIIAVRDHIAEALLASCVDEPHAQIIIRHALDEAGLTGWSIQLRGLFTTARPCASPGFDETDHIIYIIPIPTNSP